MKSNYVTIPIFFAVISLCAASALATDYSSYSMDELSKMRGTMRDLPAEERNQFRNEWQKRINEMPVEERSKYTGPPENAKRDGLGAGAKNQKNRNEYRFRNQNRTGGQNDGSGYGMGSGGGMGRGGGGGGRR